MGNSKAFHKITTKWPGRPCANNYHRISNNSVSFCPHVESCYSCINLYSAHFFDLTNNDEYPELLSIWRVLSHTLISLLEMLMTYIGPILKTLSCCAIPFGSTRTACPHHRDRFHFTMRLISRCSWCRGSCVYDIKYSMDTLCDDFAWWLYVIRVYSQSCISSSFLVLFLKVIKPVVVWMIVLVCVCFFPIPSHSDVTGELVPPEVSARNHVFMWFLHSVMKSLLFPLLLMPDNLLCCFFCGISFWKHIDRRHCVAVLLR